jgi:hypothetical protein
MLLPVFRQPVARDEASPVHTVAHIKQVGPITEKAANRQSRSKGIMLAGDCAGWSRLVKIGEERQVYRRLTGR